MTDTDQMQATGKATRIEVRFCNSPCGQSHISTDESQNDKRAIGGYPTKNASDQAAWSIYTMHIRARQLAVGDLVHPSALA